MMNNKWGKLYIFLFLCMSLALISTAGCKSSDDPTTPSMIIITVVPASVNLQVGQSQQLVANVSGTTDTAVTWSIDAGGSGTVDANGLYAAPSSVPANPSVVVRATLVADPTISGVAVITIVASPVVTHTVTLTVFEDKSGWIRKPEDIVRIAPPYVGDLDGDAWVRGFASFDLSGIPQDASIDSATLDLSNYVITGGDPFNDLDKFRVIALDFGTLDISDFSATGYETVFNETGPPGNSLNVTSSVSTAHNNGWGEYQVRFQFRNDTDGDGSADYLRFETGSGGTELKITYSTSS